MNTNLIINGSTSSAKLKDLLVGDWFYYIMPDESYVLAIKGDDTVYEGRKIICMRIMPSCGILARLNSDTPVKLIKNIQINTQ